MDDINEEDIEVRIMTSSRDLDDYDILSMPSISAAVPHNTNESFRKFIWGAMATYAFGNSSIDHVMRRYDWAWQRYKKGAFESNPDIIILRSTISIVKMVSDRLENIEIEGRLGVICAKSALIRLEASFKAAYGLIRKEYIFESDAVIRIILEQLAWSYVSYDASDENVQSLRPNKCITPFKLVFPECGKVYGRLSEWAHIDPFVVTEYLKFHNEKIPVVRRSEHNSLESGRYLVILSVIYLQLTQLKFDVLESDEYMETLSDLKKNVAAYGSNKKSPDK